MKIPRFFKQVGITTDGKAVMSGVFMFSDTHGMPLPILFMLMKDYNMVPSPQIFYDDAIKAGWKETTIFNRLEDAYCDGYGKAFWKEVEKRLIEYGKNE